MASEDDRKRARDLALRRLGIREHSESELVRYLKRRNVDAILAEDVVRELAGLGYVDNSRYARLLVREQVLRGKGPQAIALKLRQKGIRMDRDRIAELAKEASGKTDLETALEVIDRRYPRFREDALEARRAYQALVRRGFSFEVAREAVRSSAFRDTDT